MEQIKITDCYLPVDENECQPDKKYVSFNEFRKTYLLEKHTDMIVLTVEQFRKWMKEAHDHGYEIGTSPLMWDIEKSWTEFQKQNNVYQPGK